MKQTSILWLAYLRRVSFAAGFGAIASTALAQETPLLELLSAIPADVDGRIFLADHAAMRTEIAPFFEGTNSDDLARKYHPFSALPSPPGIDLHLIPFFDDGAVDALGFSIFEIEQIAGWMETNDAPIILTGVANQSEAMATALAARGFETTVHKGDAVHHRQADYEADPVRAAEEPFNGIEGHSQRFAGSGERVLHSRSWPAMRRMLGVVVGMNVDLDAVAILTAAYAAESVGALTSVILLDAPSAGEVRTGAKEEGTSLLPAGIPPFQRYGLLLWQDGASMTGAIVIPYDDEEVALTARRRFRDRLAVARSRFADRPFDDILPDARTFTMVSAGTRHVIILAFHQKLDISDPSSFTAFMLNPQRLLLEMTETHDIDKLFGR